MPPSIHPPCTHIQHAPMYTYTTWHPGTHPHHRPHLSVHVAPARHAASPEEAMGLTFGNFQYCITLIQRRVYGCLYSGYRSALRLVNRSASSSSLGCYITEIGHVNLTIACFKDCKLKLDRDQVMSHFSAKSAK